MRTVTKKQQIIFNIIIILLTIIIFYTGYALSFYCYVINADYSETFKETYKNVNKVVYCPEYNEITIYTNDGNKIIYGGVE